MSAFTFQVDVSRTYRNKDGYSAGGYRLNTSFKTETHTPESFLDSVIRQGWPYTMAHLKRSPQETGAAVRGVITPKHTENFVSRQELTGDDDSDRPGVVDFWLHDSFFAAYGWSFVESANSKPGAERGHPTFIFDRPITDPELYHEAAHGLAWKYPQLDQGIHNLDRTIYNAVGAHVHLLGNICPLDVFEREILTPYRRHIAAQAALEAEYQARRKVELEQARAEGKLRTDADSVEKYLNRTLDGIFNFVARQSDNRHSAIYWAGRKIGALEAAAWTPPHNFLFADVEARIEAAASANGYTSHPNGGKAEILRTFADGRRFGALSPAAQPELYDRPAKQAPAGPGPKERERLAARDKYQAEAKQHRTEREARRQERQAELERRYEAAAGVMNFTGDEDIDPDHVEWKRAQFTAANKWRDYCKAHYPDLDADLQCQIKLQENRESRPDKCGEYRKRTLPNGQIETYRWTCGVCDECLKKSVAIYRRALNEIQGIRVELAPGKFTPLFELESIEPDDIKWLIALIKEIWGINLDPPHEDAPPLAQIKGDLSIVRIRGDQERLRLARELRTGGILYRAIPITPDDGPAFDFIVNDDRGDPLGLINDARIELWVKGAENKRASGGLLPSLKELKQRYREALPYEVILPELDDEGFPVDPDIFALELPDIGTTAKLPAVIVDFEVKDAASLQAALLEIHREQWRILGRRGDVNYGVCVHKRFYTRYSTLPDLLADFNARQKALRLKKRKK